MEKINNSEEINRIIDIRKKLMKLHGIKFKKDFAEMLGFTKQAYYKVEKNGASKGYLNAIRHKFGVPADAILHNEKCYLD